MGGWKKGSGGAGGDTALRIMGRREDAALCLFCVAPAPGPGRRRGFRISASRRALGEPTILVTSGEERGLEGAHSGDGECLQSVLPSTSPQSVWGFLSTTFPLRAAWGLLPTLLQQAAPSRTRSHRRYTLFKPTMLYPDVDVCTYIYTYAGQLVGRRLWT